MSISKYSPFDLPLPPMNMNKEMDLNTEIIKFRYEYNAGNIVRWSLGEDLGKKVLIFFFEISLYSIKLHTQIIYWIYFLYQNCHNTTIKGVRFCNYFNGILTLLLNYGLFHDSSINCILQLLLDNLRAKFLLPPRRRPSAMGCLSWKCHHFWLRGEQLDNVTEQMCLAKAFHNIYSKYWDILCKNVTCIE